MATSVKVGGQNYTVNTKSKTPYLDIYKQYAKGQEAQHKAWINQQNTQKANDISKINSAYDTNAQQYYVNNMQSQRNLNNQLANQGINGGASESAMLRMYNAYGNNIAKNETGRQTDITSTNNQYANDLATQKQTWEANEQEVYTTMMQNQAEYNEKQKEKALQNYAASISNRWDNAKGYKNEIARLRKSNDSQKAQKIALVQQAYATWKQNHGSSGSSGSSGGYSSGGYSSGGYSSGGYSSGGYTTTSSSSSSKSTKKSSSSGRKKSTSLLGRIANAFANKKRTAWRFGGSQ